VRDPDLTVAEDDVVAALRQHEELRDHICPRRLLLTRPAAVTWATAMRRNRASRRARRRRKTTTDRVTGSGRVRAGSRVRTRSDVGNVTANSPILQFNRTMSWSSLASFFLGTKESHSTLKKSS
jgi:hypothetical protein